MLAQLFLFPEIESSRSWLLEKSFTILCLCVLSCMSSLMHIVVAQMFDVFISVYVFVYAKTLVDVVDMV